MPAPANDNFASAIALSTTLPGSLTGLTVKDSTSEVSEPAHGGFFGEDDVQSIWFTFTPTATGRYHFGIKNAFPAGTQQPTGDITVYSGGALGSLTEIIATAQGLHTSAGGTAISVCADLVSGTTYHICVAAPLYISDGTNAYTFTFDLDWDAVVTGTVPANDDANSADDLGTDPIDQAIAGTLISATVEAWEDVNLDFPSVWYRLHAGLGGLQEIHVIAPGTNFYYRPTWSIFRIINDPITDWSDLEFIDNGTQFDAVGTPTPLDSSNLFGGGGNPTTTLVAGEDYLIYVTNENGSGEWDDFTLVLGPPPSVPDNDSPETTPFTHDFYFDRSEFGAYWVYPEAAERAGTTVLATADAGEGSLAGFAATRTVWYHFGINQPGSYKIWVESAVDCVLGLYGEPNIWTDAGDLTLIDSDDDSGTGDWPEITHVFGALAFPFFGDHWLAVDAKTEGTFVLKYQRQPDGTPPANDDFADAEVISALPFSSAGTTVSATAETAEREAEQLAAGPKDTVWYKYVADHDGTLKIKATCDTFNNDAYVYIDGWHGTTLETLVRCPEPPPIGPGGGIFRGFFNHFDTALELDQAAISLDIVNGETYYIRVQTESGGSEDFTIYVDTEAVYLDLTPSGADEMHGVLIDAATIYVDLQASGTDTYRPALTTDVSTVALLLQPSGVDIRGFEYLDSATVRVVMTTDSAVHDCYFHTEPSFIADGTRKWAWTSNRRWQADGVRRWAWVEGEGLPQIC